jgi:hypothetical protein
MTAGSTAVCAQQTAEGAGRAPGSAAAGGARLTDGPVPAGQLADDYA